MSNIILEKKYALEYVKDILNDVRLKETNIKNAKYHHNTSYSNAPLVCQYGILSLQDIKKHKIRDYTDEFLTRMSDIESHINGSDSVSLSVVGLDDLYPNEDEYNPHSSHLVDFRVTSDIKAHRSTLHYGNEYLSDSISIDKLRAIDIYLLELISKESDINKVIEKYNDLIKICISMKKMNLDIPLRELSFDTNHAIDIDRLSRYQKVKLK